MKYCYKVPCKKEMLKEIRCFVKEVLDKHGLSEVDVSTLVLAIDEVCANLIIHSHCCNPKESIEVEINVDKDKGLIFNIIDKAEIFNINEYQEPTLEDIIKKQRKGGIGLILVKKIMDDIQIYSDKKKHVCRLVKKIHIN
ncbi:MULTISPECIES: ATP-binding protein [Fulvivirga]|uniref:ATP-binding protein n=1 Tax=Fulvivirga kasyanovii TaxID=396812 RepID=A0ABW9RQD6_9BACT|nr:MULTISPECIES: ATP-binding protein [Fulvivirga]MTI25916.1 ATP-binding protein [Fulvivirga kasyanovii]UII34282.1 ATP-binding protein [Fulvivirga ulvae]